VNGADAGVGPTADSISTAISNFVESAIPGVTTFNSSIDVAGAYPLATVAYAAVSVCDATIDQLENYNKLLSFAKGKGQVLGAERGDLPEGYVPLTASQKESLGSTIRAINSEISSPVCAEHASTTTIDSGVLPEVPTAVAPTDVDTEVTQTQLSGDYPDDPNSALKYSLLSALFFGAPFVVGGRLLVRNAKAING
jgi:hypothetical protein